ncbi:MAG: fumarylacetoacetate hydrolase family protein [Planctomycetota bacterium]|nr:fumarylacetoacetate hydrolase family protein [Planctomycetota bacterium]
MNTPRPQIPRIYANPASGLLLEYADRWYDLSAWASAAGHPSHLLELITSGLLHRDQFADSLPGSGSSDWIEVPTPDLDKWDPPLSRPEVGKVLCLGKNFAAHAAEFGEDVPTEPLWFGKLPDTIVGHGAQVTVRPWYTDRVDHEAEVALVISKQGSDLTLENAMEYVGGWMVANDLTARSMQGAHRKLGHPWMPAKNMDGFLPLGPCLVPAGFIDPHDLRVTCQVGTELRQDASTQDLVVRVEPALVALSKHLTLYPGDIVLMGTPEGVGPLQDGDEVVCDVDHIGALSTRILRPKS